MSKPESPRDWKFYAQIGVLASGITGGLAVNTSTNERVLKLEINSQYQLETIKELRDEVKSLRNALEAKKIVNRVAESDPVARQEFFRQR